MKPFRFDIGLTLAVLGAMATTIFVASTAFIGITQTETDCSYCDFHPVFFAFAIPAVIGSWLGVWAWWQRRWLLAALGFVASIAAPVGYLIELTAPIGFGLMIASLVRVWKGRRATTKSAAHEPGR
jgi:hypothetical protein